MARSNATIIEQLERDLAASRRDADNLHAALAAARDDSKQAYDRLHIASAALTAISTTVNIAALNDQRIIEGLPLIDKEH